MIPCLNSWPCRNWILNIFRHQATQWQDYIPADRIISYHPEKHGSPGTTTRPEPCAACVVDRGPGCKPCTYAGAGSGLSVRTLRSHSGREGFYTYNQIPVIPVQYTFGSPFVPPGVFVGFLRTNFHETGGDPRPFMEGRQVEEKRMAGKNGGGMTYHSKKRG